MNRIVPAERTKNVQYAIRDLAVKAAEYAKVGKEVLYLNIGDPVVFDFYTPVHMIDSVDQAMRENKNGYVDSMGVKEAREAIAKEAVEKKGIKTTPDDVLVTAGVSEGLDLALTSLVNPGDNILIPSPCYPLYTAILNKLGTIINKYRTDEANGWQPDLDDIKRKVNGGTKGILINNPNNPTGALYSKGMLENIVDVARDKNLVIFADEIYDKILFDGEEHVPLARVAGDTPVLTLNGLSKNYLVPGWRVGWMIFSGLEDIRVDYQEAICKLARARLCAPGPFQYAVKPALEGPQDHIPEMIAKLTARRDLFVDTINSIHGFSCVKPKGAFYAFPGINFPVEDDKKFVLEVLDKSNILVVHGTGFDYDKPDHFRVVLLPKSEILQRSLDKLERYSKELYVE